MGGIRAALDLAETGRDVVLIDKDFAIGGLMTQLDRTFPTNNCDLCTLSPHLSESGRKLHIQLMTMTQLSGLSGEAGHFKATLTTQPRYIDLAEMYGLRRVRPQISRVGALHARPGSSGAHLHAVPPGDAVCLFHHQE